MTDQTTRSKANRRSALRLGVVVLAMFGFGYALVPLYDVFCQVTGLNGRTGVVQAGELDGRPDTDRLVTVEFTGTVSSALPWEFEPSQLRMKVHPGQLYDTHFVARNVGAAPLTGQAVPSVAPNTASLYFKKTECFCFSTQHLEAGESREMPVRFVIEKGLPRNVRTVTLSYTFFRQDGAG